MSAKTPPKGLQTAPDKRGKIKNCTAGKSYPCGKACIGIGSAILESCLKKLKPEVVEKAKDLGNVLNNKANENESQPQQINTKSKIEGNTKVKVKGNIDALEGRKDTTPDELNAIGVRKKDDEDIELTDNEIERINQVRNGYNSVEDFLNADPKEHIGKELVLFAGSRVEMHVSDDGSVGFSVDESLNVNFTNKEVPKPTKELMQMTRSWEKYTNSPSGKRIFNNSPYSEGGQNDRFQARAEAYQRFGFQPAKIYEPVNKTIKEINRVQFLDNRMPDTTIQDLASFYNDLLGSKIVEMAKNTNLQNSIKSKFLNSSKDERQKFLKAKSADEIIDWLKSSDAKELEEITKILKIAESNLSPQNIGIDAKTFIFAFPKTFISELVKIHKA